MKSEFSDTLLVAILSFLVYLSEVRDWVAISLGLVSFVWILYQLVSRIRADLGKRKENK